MSKCHCMPCLKQNYVTLAVKSQVYLGLMNPWRVFHTPHPSLCSDNLFYMLYSMFKHHKTYSMNSKRAALPHYLLVNSGYTSYAQPFSVRSSFKEQVNKQSNLKWLRQENDETIIAKKIQMCVTSNYSSLQKTILSNEKCISLNCHCCFLAIKLKIHTRSSKTQRVATF